MGTLGLIDNISLDSPGMWCNNERFIGSSISDMPFLE